MASLKIEFDTVRDLEKKSSGIFMYGGGGLAAGFILSFVGLGLIGIPLLVLSGVVLIGGIAYVSMLGKEPSRPVFCPYCTSKNEVYQSRRKFDCDICKRPVIITETGEAVMAEAIDTQARI